MANLAEIRAFLEAHNYTFREPSITTHKSDRKWIALCPNPYSGYRQDVFNAREETKIYKLSLNHFLTHWLGLYWHDMYKLLPVRRLLAKKTSQADAIEKAIAYHEALEAL